MFCFFLIFRIPVAKKKGCPKVKVEHGESKKRSRIWTHFTELEDDKENPKAECNYCKIDYACHKIRNGTSAIKNHLTKHCKHFPLSKKNAHAKQKTQVFEPINKDGNSA